MNKVRASKMPALPTDLADAQSSRLASFAATACVDLHCHCLPCVDDGPDTLVESLALCRALVADGITTVVATPHQLGRYHGKNGGAEVRRAVAALQRNLAVEGVPLDVLPGADVRLDERIERLLSDGVVLSLADTSYVLLELPSDAFIEPRRLIDRLVAKGFRPIISHPERNRFVTARPALVQPWLDAGACLQLTAGSLAGDFGPVAQRSAWFWLEGGQGAIVASDAHSVDRRPPRLTEAIRLITSRLGMAVTRRVCIENPRRVVDDRPLELPPPGRTDDALEDLDLSA